MSELDERDIPDDQSKLEWLEQEKANLQSQLDHRNQLFKQAIKDNCDFEDELLKLLAVRERKDDHDGTDAVRIVERCRELLEQLDAVTKERDELLKDKETLRAAIDAAMESK